MSYLRLPTACRRHVSDKLPAFILEHFRGEAERLADNRYSKQAIRSQLTTLAVRYGMLETIAPAIPDLAEVEDTGDDVDLEFMTSEEFFEADFPQDFLIQNVLAEGQPHLNSGSAKTLKTGIGVLDAGISLASGTPFLGVFPVKRSLNVGIISAESGPHTLQRNGRTICAARGIYDPRDLPLYWSTRMPPLTQYESIIAIQQFIQVHKIEVLLIDPLYMALLDTESAGQAGNLFAMGARLKELSLLSQDTGVLLSMSHHCKKMNRFDQRRNQPAELEDISMAGFAEWARQWTLYSRREPYRPGTGIHELWVNIGGSSGHSGLYAVTVDEGVPTSPRWEVTVRPAGEVYAEQAQQRSAEKERKATNKRHERLAGLVNDVLAAAEERGDWASRNEISKLAGKDRRTASEELFTNLVEDGRLEVRVQSVRGKPTKLYRSLGVLDVEKNSTSKTSTPTVE